ncbi:hypothetical protein JMUB7552_27420 [Staphylococcus aureus]
MSRGLGDVYKRQGMSHKIGEVHEGEAAVSYTHLTLPTTPYV